MITNSGNISVWRGKDTPPTLFHLWEREDENTGEILGLFHWDETLNDWDLVAGKGSVYVGCDEPDTTKNEVPIWFDQCDDTYSAGYTLTKNDRDKLDLISITGDGTKFWTDNGTYEEISESDPVFTAWKNASGIAAGSGATIGGTGIAIGNQANGYYGIAIGAGAVAGLGAISLWGDTSNAEYGITIGRNTTNVATHSIAFGSYAEVLLTDINGTPSQQNSVLSIGKTGVFTRRIINVGTPINDNDAATKAYVDSMAGGGNYLALTGTQATVQYQSTLAFITNGSITLVGTLADIHQSEITIGATISLLSGSDINMSTNDGGKIYVTTPEIVLSNDISVGGNGALHLLNNLNIDSGSDIVLHYNSTNAAMLLGEDEEGIQYNLISLRVYNPNLSNEFSQIEIGSGGESICLNTAYTTEYQDRIAVDAKQSDGTTVKKFLVYESDLSEKFVPLGAYSDLTEGIITIGTTNSIIVGIPDESATFKHSDGIFVTPGLVNVFSDEEADIGIHREDDFSPVSNLSLRKETAQLIVESGTAAKQLFLNITGAYYIKTTSVNPTDNDEIATKGDIGKIAYASGDLSEIGSSVTLTFDGITGTITNTDGTFLTMEFSAETNMFPVDMLRTLFSGSGVSTQRLESQTLSPDNSASFPPSTIGANNRVEIDITYNGVTYQITAGATADLTRCWGYVEKFKA